MSTHSRIAIKLEDGRVKSIYCHFDGYTDGVGQMLFRHYQDKEKVEKLIELGDASSLEAEIIPKGEHSYREPEKGVTVFYGRDRGEKGTAAQIHSSEEGLARETSDIKYLYENGVWYILRNDYTKVLLEDKL